MKRNNKISLWNKKTEIQGAVVNRTLINLVIWKFNNFLRIKINQIEWFLSNRLMKVKISNHRVHKKNSSNGQLGQGKIFSKNHKLERLLTKERDNKITK